jgi:hypothetical protein
MDCWIIADIKEAFQEFEILVCVDILDFNAILAEFQKVVEGNLFIGVPLL